MVKVFAWPPVGVVARYWTMELPTGRSRSLIDGSERVSTAQRRRLVAGMDVNGRHHYGAGYMEALWRLMDGGVHLVRLTVCRIPWGRTAPNLERGGGWFEWINPPGDIEWQGPPQPFFWFHGSYLTYTITTDNGFPAITVSGLPPNEIIALPGEFVTVHENNADVEGTAIMVVAVARSNGAGKATIRLMEAPLWPGRVSIGARESGVFRLQSEWPRAWRRAGSTDSYALEFRQVFEDETDGFTEVDPWR